MEFVVLNETEYDSVCNNFLESSFYQTSTWAKIKKNNGWICYYVGVKENDKIVACSLILGKKIYLNKYLYYAPRGLLLDYNNLALLDFFITELKKFLIKKNGIIFKMDPLVKYKNHDRNGEYLSDNFSNQSIVDNLTKLGFKHKGFTIGYSDEAQFRWSYCMEIDKDIDEIFKTMNQRCRRSIKKSKRYPISIVEVDDNNILDFKKIMEHTASRQKHFDRDINYYKTLNKEFGLNSKLVIAYLDKNKFINEFKDDKLYEVINNIDRDKIPLSAGVFIFDKNRANYVYGGTYKNYMPLMAQYKVQLEMIMLAQKRGLKLYDFGGISGDFTPNSDNYGVYDFKRGFPGYVLEYIGEFDLVLDKLGNQVYNKGHDLYRNLKHFSVNHIKINH